MRLSHARLMISRDFISDLLDLNGLVRQSAIYLLINALAVLRGFVGLRKLHNRIRKLRGESFTGRRFFRFFFIWCSLYCVRLFLAL